MAKATVLKDASIADQLQKLSGRTEEVAKKAIYAGAKILTDEIRSNLENLPEDQFRYLQEGEKFNGVPKDQKKDLEESLGVTPIKRDKHGDWNAKIGFDGYGSFPTKKYPKGVPNNILARSIESGSSVRQKTPFVRPAIRKKKKEVLAAMQTVVDEEISKMGGK